MYNIIKRPLVTEKNTLRSGLFNEHGFEVAVDANRKQIKEAIEKLFGVKVARVNTMVCRAEPRRLGKMPGKMRYTKKAIVKLKDGEKFEFTAS